MRAADELIGQQIGNFEIQSVVGRGAMAKVYRALEHPLERTVAIKVMAPSVEDDPTFARRFLQEARAIAALHHPNILTIYHYGEWQGRPYIVTELMDGGSLQELLQQQGPLPLAEAVDIISKIGSALEEAHSHNIVHRDLKPSNVLLDQSHTRPVLADFGIAKIINNRDDGSLTMAGTSLGTPEYMSPEQAMGGKIDRRSDIYSLAIVLYRLLTGRLPFERESPLATLIAHTRDIPTPPRHYNPALPPAVEQVILRCLEKDPNRRYQTVSEMVNALRQAAGMGQKIAPQPMPPLDPRPVTDVSPDEMPGKSEGLSWEQPTSANNEFAGANFPRDEARDFTGAEEEYYPDEPPTAVVTPNPYRQPRISAQESYNNPNAGLVVPAEYSASYPATTANPQPLTPDPRPLTSNPRPRWLFPLMIGVLVLVAVIVGAGFLFNGFGAGDQGSNSTNSGPVPSTKEGLLLFSMVENDKWDIYSMKPDGTNLKKLTNNTDADNLSPTLSPDGKTLAYVAARSGGRWQIRRMNLDGSNNIPLTPGTAQDQYPAWSPDGKQIIFSSTRETGGSGTRLYVMNADGNNVTRLNDDNAGYSSWSPAKQVAYTYFNGNFHALRHFDPATRATKDLTSERVEYDFPVWSPDATHLLAVRGSNSDRAIYLMDANGGNLKRLSPSGETATNPVWSPDGKRVTYLVRVGTDSSGRDRWELAQINADGSGHRQLTSDGKQKFYLSWGVA